MKKYQALEKYGVLGEVKPLLMEEEVPGLLRILLFIVMVPVVVLTINLRQKYKRYGFGWILCHLLLFTFGALWWIRILETRAFTSSAYNSIAITCIGIMWTFSMVFFVQGMLDLSRKIRELQQK